MTSNDLLQFDVKLKQKEAEKLWQSILEQGTNKKIAFLLISEGIPATECVWIDPYLGFFAIKDKIEDGFLTIASLPKFSLIVNQRLEDKE